ncbi:MAG: SecY-interacting protein [Colwellia sp.]|jgi:SecY interacting protein Syd|nr:MAG: SecY-interacting protein [Colwellia sp.]
MTSSNQANEHLVQMLKQFSEQYVAAYQKIHGCLPAVEHDKEWPSPCELHANEQNPLPQGEVYWQPVVIEKSEKLSFDNVESALELTLHEDIKQYFTFFYSESLHAQCDEGELSLLFSWNKNDFERLQENLIGHILMKKRLKQKETIFFAVTDEEDMIISVDNTSGSVWVERVGCKPHKQISDSLAQFISQLTPVIK